MAMCLAIRASRQLTINRSRCSLQIQLNEPLLIQAIEMNPNYVRWTVAAPHAFYDTNQNCLSESLLAKSQQFFQMMKYIRN